MADNEKNTEVVEKAPAKVEKAAPKESFFKRTWAKIKKFCKTIKSELKKVTWLSHKQTFQSTLLVLVVMIVFGVVLGVLDFGFSKGLEFIAGLLG